MADKPDVAKMLEYFKQNFKLDTTPCKKIKYNCAVRLSLALNAGGFSVGDYKDLSRVHNSEKNHSHKWDKVISDASTVPHLVSAENMYDHLRGKFSSFHQVHKIRHGSKRSQIAHQKGVLFFENCFTRKGQSSKRGDHIDIWDGVNYGNEILGIDAAGRSGSGEDLFSKARKVYFLRL